MEKLSHDGFFQHPMNRAMLEGGGFPPYDPSALALKYIKLAQSGQRPTEEQVEAVRVAVTEFCKSVHGGAALEADLRGIEKTWPEMHERFANSLGLTQMMLDFGAQSRYFYQYLYNTGKKRYAVALETKDGLAMPVSGEMKFEEIPEGDACKLVAVEEPSHPARRQTDWRPQTILRNSDSIFEAGAGLMPAYRHYGYPLGKLNQRIVACDSDPEMLTYFPMLFGVNPEDVGVEYVVGDSLDVMDDPHYHGKFGTVRLTGFLSYFPKFEDKRTIMMKAKRLLRPGGKIVGDLWIAGLSLARTALIQLWPIDQNDPHRLAPAADEATALAEIDELCAAIGLPHVSLKDVCNGNSGCYTQAAAGPKCMMFLATENADITMFDPVPIAGSPYSIDAV